MPEPKPSKKGIADRWDNVSRHPLWAAVIAALIVAAIAAHSGGVFGGSSTASSSRTPRSKAATSAVSEPLRVAFHPTAPTEYGVAFERDIGLPKTAEQWESLHNRGGIDVGASDYHFVLANSSGIPLTITDIEAVVRSSKPRPVGSLASVYSQGVESLEKFGVDLARDTKGATAPFHRIEIDSAQLTLDPASAPLFFPSHKIALAPNEIYEATVTLLAKIPDELEYGFVITGNTARGSFTSHTPSFLIVGYARYGEPGYGHEYWMLPESSGHTCWVPANKSGGFPRCP